MSKPSVKQEKQRKLYLALGAVTGFPGYLRSLDSAVRSTSLEHVEKARLAWNIEHIRRALIVTEGSLRKAMRNL